MGTIGRRVICWVSAMAILASVLVSLGCGSTDAPGTIPAAAIIGDNSGGGTAFYQTWRMSANQSHVDFCAQRISSEGYLVWGEGGRLIDGYDAASYSVCDSYAVSDGSGGAVLIWEEPSRSQVNIARVDSQGNVDWQTDIPRQGIEEIKGVISDGSEGVIIAYVDEDMNMSALKTDAEGSLPWGSDGVPLNMGDSYLSDMASDNSGGIIVVRYGGGNISAQRVDSGGNVLWQTGGVEICGSLAGEAVVVSDGTGGAIIAFARYIPSGGGTYSDSDIYAQRIDAEGNLLWGPDGARVSMKPPDAASPSIVNGGAGGAIIFFGDGTYVYAQRIDADGHRLWAEDIEVWKGNDYSVVSDDFDGAIGAWDERTQRVDGEGRTMWGPDGTTAMVDSSGWYLISPDGYGGVLVSWTAVAKSASGYEGYEASYYVQRVDAEGDIVWGDEGILLNR
jgi:hypothetical protein